MFVLVHPERDRGPLVRCRLYQQLLIFRTDFLDHLLAQREPDSYSVLEVVRVLLGLVEKLEFDVVIFLDGAQLVLGHPHALVAHLADNILLEVFLAVLLLLVDLDSDGLAGQRELEGVVEKSREDILEDLLARGAAEVLVLLGDLELNSDLLELRLLFVEPDAFLDGVPDRERLDLLGTPVQVLVAQNLVYHGEQDLAVALDVLEVLVLLFEIVLDLAAAREHHDPVERGLQVVAHGVEELVLKARHLLRAELFDLVGDILDDHQDRVTVLPLHLDQLNIQRLVVLDDDLVQLREGRVSLLVREFQVTVEEDLLGVLALLVGYLRLVDIFEFLDDFPVEGVLRS